jgi:uncharacterized GH25 family protein
VHARTRISLAAVALAALAAGAAAHDFWIEPASWRPEASSILQVRLRVGDFALGDEAQRDEERILRFELAGEGIQRPIVGRDGGTPAGFVRLAGGGVHVLGYEGRPASVELDSAKFEAYLRERGLDEVLAERARTGEAKRGARERYARCAKAIVRVGGEGGPGWDRALGLALELVPEGPPRPKAGGGAELDLRLVHQGEPLGGALVRAMPLKGPVPEADVLGVRTGPAGQVRLQLPHPGPWLVASVHMRRAPAGSDCDWESLWASLTLEVAQP